MLTNSCGIGPPSNHGRVRVCSERGVRRAPDLLPGDYAGSEEESGSLCD
jgi:hypothetical protein